MWALKEASGAPMPVIVDTPLGRLDSDHRLSVVQNYFPRASHQVVLLATDAEVDDQIWPGWPRRFRGLTV
jgi:DNA sulfur modification protein DndD